MVVAGAGEVGQAVEGGGLGAEDEGAEGDGDGAAGDADTLL